MIRRNHSQCCQKVLQVHQLLRIQVHLETRAVELHYLPQVCRGPVVKERTPRGQSAQTWHLEAADIRACPVERATPGSVVTYTSAFPLALVQPLIWYTGKLGGVSAWSPPIIFRVSLGSD